MVIDWDNKLIWFEMVSNDLVIWFFFGLMIRIGMSYLWLYIF